MTPEEFHHAVEAALEGLPPDFADRLENVAVVVRDEATEEDLREAGLDRGQELFGLYVGIPLTDRSSYNMTLPDRILIFQGPHERHFRDEDLVSEIGRTVVHEIAHLFGIDDDRLHELGYA